MDWKDLGPLVGASAPLIGKLIGIGVSFIPGVGPITGPIIGPVIGDILAKQFGVPSTPDAVASALTTTDADVVKAKLAAATEEVKARYKWAARVETGELQLEERGIEQTNETMRAETASTRPRSLYYDGWRPFIGWVFGAFLATWDVLLAAATLVTLFRADDPLASIQAAWPIYLATFSVHGLVVGVYIKAKTDERVAGVSPSQPAAPLPSVAAPPSAKPLSPPKPAIRLAPVLAHDHQAGGQ